MYGLLNKKRKYDNSFYLLASIFILLFSLKKIVNTPDANVISIINNGLFGYPLLVLSIISLAYFLAYYIFKFYLKEKLVITKKILLWVLLFFSFLILFDLIMLGIVRNFVIAFNLSTKPTSDIYSLGVRICYILINNYSSILNGVFTTLWLSLLGTVIGLIIGLLFVSLKTLEVTSRDSELVAFFKKVGYYFVQVYVTVFRGTPMMVQAIIIYYFLPGILSNLFNIDQASLNTLLSVGVVGLITVSLNTTAYLTEVLRGGIESINRGQMEAARSLGMTRSKAMCYVIYPQAIKNSLPSICNEFIVNIKDTSVLSVISVMDLFFVIDFINGKAGNQDGIFIAAIIYLFLTYTISKVLGVIEKKMNLVAKPLPSSN